MLTTACRRKSLCDRPHSFGTGVFYNPGKLSSIWIYFLKNRGHCVTGRPGNSYQCVCVCESEYQPIGWAEHPPLAVPYKCCIERNPDVEIGMAGLVGSRLPVPHYLTYCKYSYPVIV